MLSDAKDDIGVGVSTPSCDPLDCSMFYKNGFCTHSAPRMSNDKILYQVLTCYFLVCLPVNRTSYNFSCKMSKFWNYIFWYCKRLLEFCDFEQHHWENSLLQCSELYVLWSFRHIYYIIKLFALFVSIRLTNTAIIILSWISLHWISQASVFRTVNHTAVIFSWNHIPISLLPLDLSWL